MSSTASPSTEFMLPLILEEHAGIDRRAEPVTVGVPFPKGALRDDARLSLRDPQGQTLPFQFETLERWPLDHSVKWGLFDFQADAPAHSSANYSVKCLAEQSPPPSRADGVALQILRDASDAVRVDTGAAEFVIDSSIFRPFKAVKLKGVNVIDSSQNHFSLLDENGAAHEHRIRNIAVETEGALRCTLKIEGEIEGVAEFFARLHFYANHSFVKIDYTILNPKAAQHPGGLWDLGDAGSVLFQDLSLQMALPAQETVSIAWSAREDAPLQEAVNKRLSIYQDSSGGEHWQSSNHRNRDGEVMSRFCGYRVESDHLLEEGRRASPIVVLQNERCRLTAALQNFWQNFPKAFDIEGSRLSIRLFPAQYADLFELQGGEQKTHTIYLSFDPADETASALHWIQQPLIARSTPQWYAASGAIHYLLPEEEEPCRELIDLLNNAIEGENTFWDRRERIDEYGWRNFGELYADHEAVFYKGEGTPVSHYNNQYDGVYGMALQFLRSGDLRWFGLMRDLTRHVIDIDIYHTEQDKAAYNGGLFWHTDHYSDAGTGTHRCYSRLTMLAKGLSAYGGGLSNEHNYATGLRHHYYLTGEIASKEAAIGLANWVVNMDDGAQTPFKRLNRRPTGLASTTNSPDYSYHGPGRGSGYSVTTLLDAYALTAESSYLVKAEELIRRCIHPHDDIDALELDNSELRWSYTVFLQALGKYLDVKHNINAHDRMFCYARDSLLHYALWMQEHEVCFATIYETLEYPTETWPAQDFRKNIVFHYAAQYAEEPLRSAFLRKAQFFFEHPLHDLLVCETRTLTRPLILLMTNALMHSYCRRHPVEETPSADCSHDFGKALTFKPQLFALYKLRSMVYNVIQQGKYFAQRRDRGKQ